MNSFRVFSRQARRITATVALLLASIVPALTPALASADQVTTRFIELSNSAKSATGVTYRVNFTAIQAAGAFVVDFCNDTPIIGQTCTAPTGFNASSAASTTSGFTSVTGSTSQIIVAGTINASDNVSVAITGITNPSVTSPLYARIITYTDGTDAAGYTSTDPDAVGDHIDDGGLALSITDKISVSAAVLETMTFCVSKGDGSNNNPITAGCTGTLVAPTLTLGETVGSVKALTSGAVSTGDIYSQISTNAASGAVVNLKSSVTCGGLKRLGASVCDIAPALTSGITAGQSKFGVKVNADSTTDTALSASGTFQAVSGSGYNGSTYALNYLANNSTGVTSVYGDPILDTNGTQPSNRNMKLTFAASISNNTPAGNYTGDLSLIATGKF
jgi:hypothetical protein